jgi:Putative bacterial sensory transduction regulator
MSPAEIISKDEFTTAKLLEIYNQAYMDADIDEDGEIKLELDGFRLFAAVDSNRGEMRLFSIFALTPESSPQPCLELCNRINGDLVMIRATLLTGPPPRLFLDHYLLTQGGVTGRGIVDTTRRFRSLIDAIVPLDTENLLP